MTKRIVVTGIGATSAIGGTAPDNWSNLLAGMSGTRTLEHDWVQQYELPVTFAGTPIAKAPAGMSPVTYEPEATIASAPTRQPA